MHQVREVMTTINECAVRPLWQPLNQPLMFTSAPFTFAGLLESQPKKEGRNEMFKFKLS